MGHETLLVGFPEAISRQHETGRKFFTSGPATTTPLMSSRRSPAASGAPRPETGRRRGAGLLASGSPLLPAFPRRLPQWPMGGRSPVTVAGAAAGFSPAFPSSLSGTSRGF